ncbi:MAG TPA: hypothetical protein VGK00_06675 [Anaerolineales bacterium]|jgi:hypothetical protein
MKLRQFRGLFALLEVPDPAYLPGTYRAEFVGPGWLRASSGPALRLSGLGGWWGKRFNPDGSAINIVHREGEFSEIFPMKVVRATSFIDHAEGLSLHYLAGNPFPWMFVVDEVRQLDEETLLGMSMANLSGLRGLAFPFILEKIHSGTARERFGTGPLPRLEN